MEETQEDDVSEKNKGAIRREKLGSIEFKDTTYRYPEADIDTLRTINLTVNEGEKVAILGRNGSGKSTLAKVMAGHEDYDVTSGDVLLNGTSLLDMEVDERSRQGLFLAFQYPAEIPGVSNANFLRAAR